MRSLRLAILGECPCDRCVAACCKQNGHEYAVLLEGDEQRKFAAFSVEVPLRAGASVVIERALPYRDGRCQFLGNDDRCTIYDDRPANCRRFECLSAFHLNGTSTADHGQFLKRNPHVLNMLETL